MLRCVELRQTGEAFPSQWEGRLDDGRVVYIRYLLGALAVGIGATIDDAALACKRVPILLLDFFDSYDSVMTTAEMAEHVRDVLEVRFPEAFEAQDTLLETGSPEEVALYRLVIGPQSPWELDLTERQRQAMRKLGLMKFAAGRWHITDAGLAEARRHRARP